HQRDAAGQRLEHTDGWNTGQVLDIWAARNVHRQLVAGEYLRRLEVGQPAAVGDTEFGQRLERVVRVAHAVDGGIQAQLGDRAEQEGAQLLPALVVAPVADPDQVSTLLQLRQRPEQLDVGSLVPGPGAA